MPSEPMKIQEQGFRTGLFGFDKNDVLAYMNALANEAQQTELAYKQKIERLQAKLDEAQSQNSAAPAPAPEAAADTTQLDELKARLAEAEAARRESEAALEEERRKTDTYRAAQKESQKNANIWQLKCHDLQQQVEDVQKQLAEARQAAAPAPPTPDAVREARMEARKILADAHLYAESAEKELKQQADAQKTRMAENARGIAAGVMLVRERLARVDQRLSAATLDLDGVTRAIYKALDETEDELKALGTEMRDFAQGTPETDEYEDEAAPAAPAAQKPASKLRLKATVQPVRAHRAAKPARRLRSTRRPVSQLLRDELDALEQKQ